MGSHIQPQAGELDAGFIDDLCGLRVHINIPPFALGRIACAVCQMAYLFRPNIPEIAMISRSWARSAAPCAAPWQYYCSWGRWKGWSPLRVCLDKIDDQIHCVLRAAGVLGSGGNFPPGHLHHGRGSLGANGTIGTSIPCPPGYPSGRLFPGPSVH